jgi:hypothetical protein
MDEKYGSNLSKSMNTITESQIFYYIAYPFKELFKVGEEVYDDNWKDDIDDMGDYIDDKFTDAGGFLKEIYLRLVALDWEGIKRSIYEKD